MRRYYLHTRISAKAIPKDWPVQPLTSAQVTQWKKAQDWQRRTQWTKAQDWQRSAGLATCGNCGLTWDDGTVTSMTPAPSARCPFESFHKPDNE